MRLNKVLPMTMLLILFFIFVIGGIGTQIANSIFLSIVVPTFFLGIKLIKNQKVEFPKFFGIYIIFLLILFIHSQIDGGKIIFSLTFLSGGLIWLLFYNYKDFFENRFEIFLLLICSSMSFFYFKTISEGKLSIPYDNLYITTSSFTLHNHLGDLWAIVLIPIIYYLIINPKPINILITLIGLIFLYTSFSRSALLALLSGLIYVYFNQNKPKKAFLLIAFIISGIFIIFGFSKPILGDRPYFMESLMLFIRHPLGVGIGNFSQFYSYGSLSHNLFLELLMGMGIFSLPFFVWLFRVFREFHFNNKNTIFKAIFIAISVNFFFDTTYVIPTMVWLWFAALAMIPVALDSDL